MAGTVENARLWTTADVYVGDDDATIPTNIFQPFNGDWTAIGLLDGDAGIEESRNVETSSFFAWGGILLRKSRKNFEMTFAFTALEDNQTVFELIYPGSTYGTDIVVPQVVPKRLAFEVTDTTQEVVRRYITTNYAEIDLNGTMLTNEAEMQKFPLLATIIPDATVDPAQLFTVQTVDYS